MNNLAYSQLYMARSELIAQWIAAVGQIIAAIMLIIIAHRTYIYTKKNIKATCIKNLNDAINDWNKLVISSQSNMNIAIKLRDPIIGQPDDSVIFIYLNFLHTVFVMRKEKLMKEEILKSNIGNGISWLSRIDREKFSRLLSRGYESEFKDLLLNEYDKHPK